MKNLLIRGFYYSFDLKIKNYSNQTIETYNYNEQFMQYLKAQYQIENIEDVMIKLYIQKVIRRDENNV
jgi:integrase/recombinase XerD